MAKYLETEGTLRDGPRIFGTIVPEGEKARITHWNGKITASAGPQRTPWFSRVEFFNKTIIPEGEQGYLIDQGGNYEEIIGPKVIHIHPEGEREARRMLTVYNTLEDKVGAETARRVLILKQASSAKALYITPGLLSGL